MQATMIFRTWLAIGLAANLVLTQFVSSTLFGPLWLWLIAIPLLAYVLMRAPNAVGELRQNMRRAWARRTRVQAIRVIPRNVAIKS
jgi:hypothetical protein